MPRPHAELTALVAIFDTNTLISATIFPGSVPDRALSLAWQTGRVAFSVATLEEIAEVLQRKKSDRYLARSGRLAITDRFIRKSTVISVSTQVKLCRDPKDDKFLSLAAAANATHLITGDLDLLALHPFRQTRIVTPADFLTTHGQGLPLG